MRKINIPKDLLQELYVDNKMTTYEIADELGTSRQTINNKLKEHGIPIRDSLFKPKPKKLKVKKRNKDYTDPEVFQKVYSELKAIDLVARYFGVNEKTAFTWKKKHGIETIRENSDFAKDKRMEGRPWYDKELLATMYETYSSYQLANMWNCNVSTIQKWLQKHDIPRKSLKEQWKRDPKFGESFNISGRKFDLQEYKKFYRIEARLSKRVSILIKDLVGECQSCGEKEVLDIHHIDENNLNNLPENHAVLCPNCHAKIHRLGKTVEDLVPDFKDWSTLLNTYAEAK